MEQRQSKFAKDPVCGMVVNIEKAISTSHDGKSYYFCSPGCKQKFEADPQGYLSGRISQGMH